MTLTFGGVAAEAGAACSSKSRESIVVDDELATTAALATTLARLAGTAIGTTTATTSATTASSTLLEFVIDGGGESEKSGVSVGLDSVHIAGTKVVSSTFNMDLSLGSSGNLVGVLLVLSANGSSSEKSLGLGGLVGLVVGKSVANFFLFFLNDGLGLRLALTGLLLLGSTLHFFLLAIFTFPLLLSASLTLTVGFASSVLSVHGMSILTGLTGEPIAFGAATLLGSVDLSGTVFSDKSGSGATTTASALTTATTTTAISTALTTATTALTATTAISTVLAISTTTLTTTTTVGTAGATGTTGSGLGPVVDLFELFLVNLGGGGLLEDDLLAGSLLRSLLLLLGLLEGFLCFDFLGVSEGSKFVSFLHSVIQEQRVRILI